MHTLLLFLIMSGTLLWVPPASFMEALYTVGAILPLLVLSRFLSKLKTEEENLLPVRVALILTAFGTAIACSCSLNRNAMIQNLVCTAVFLVFRKIPDLRLLSRPFQFYRSGILKLLALFLLPGFMILTRLSHQADVLTDAGGKTAAYLRLNIGGKSIMVLPFLILMAPLAFTLLFSLTAEIKVPFFGKGSIRLAFGNLLLIFYALLIAGLAALNDDFGCAVILSGTAILLYFCAGYNLWAKLLIMAGGAGGSFVLMLLSPKIRGRLAVFMNMRQAVKDEVFGAESIAYILQTAPAWSFWGRGPGTEYPIMDRAYFTADYIFGCVLSDYGLITGLLVFVLSLVMVICLLKSDVADRTDRIYLYSVCIMYLISIFFSAGGNLGALPLTGICYPFLSLSLTINAAFYINLAIAMNIQKRGVCNEI